MKTQKKTEPTRKVLRLDTKLVGQIDRWRHAAMAEQPGLRITFQDAIQILAASGLETMGKIFQARG